MAKKFVTDRAINGLEIVAGKYQFINGVMEVSDTDAEKLAPILTKFYGCRIEEGGGSEYQDGVDSMPDGLLASQTLAAERVGHAAAVEAMMRHGEEAGDPRNVGTLSGQGRIVGPNASLATAPITDPKDADPKILTPQSVANEATNQENTGGQGSTAITGVPASAPEEEEEDEEE